MSDIRAMFDDKYIKAWDLNGKDVTLVIKGVKAEVLKNGKNEARKPIIYFERAKKGFACNKTNQKVISRFYGHDTREWIGKAITLYPTTTTFGHEEVDCIRVRNVMPRPGPKQAATANPTPEDVGEGVSDSHGPDANADGELPMSDEERAAAIDAGDEG